MRRLHGVLLSALCLMFTTGINSCEPQEWTMKVLVIAYYAYDESGTLIDPVQRPMPSAFDSLAEQRASMEAQVEEAIVDLENASRYQGHSDPAATSALHYEVVDVIEKIEPKPWEWIATHNLSHLDYQTIMTDVDICDWVEDQGVREVWLFKTSNQDLYRHDESRMIGPHGWVANAHLYPPSPGFPRPMPVCANSYRVYTHDMDRPDLFMHVWGHQLESELRNVATTSTRSAIDTQLLNNWQGPCAGSSDTSCAPPTASVVGRCGTVHIPPNGTGHYDVANTTPWATDCLDWDPDGIGPTTLVSCADWGSCLPSPWTIEDNPDSNWQVWHWQNLPGKGTVKEGYRRRLRNWWSIHGNFDHVKTTGLGLSEPPHFRFAKTTTERDQYLAMGDHCVSVNEPNEPAGQGWADNYLCSRADVGLRFKSNGVPPGGGTCVNLLEIYDVAHWGYDNWICADEDFDFEWSMSGPISGKTCEAWDENLDPDGWNNNYLCWG